MPRARSTAGAGTCTCPGPPRRPERGRRAPLPQTQRESAATRPGAPCGRSRRRSASAALLGLPRFVRRDRFDGNAPERVVLDVLVVSVRRRTGLERLVLARHRSIARAGGELVLRL